MDHKFYIIPKSWQSHGFVYNYNDFVGFYAHRDDQDYNGIVAKNWADAAKPGEQWENDSVRVICIY